MLSIIGRESIRACIRQITVTKAPKIRCLFNHAQQRKFQMSSRGTDRAMSSFCLRELLPYEAPSWATNLLGIPKWKVKLAMLPTPIHRWDVPGLPEDVELFIKRDDMTGSTLSGNKVRKLEFLLADALDQGCNHVITMGGAQSNHCRATAIAARQLGLKSHLLLRTDDKTTDELGCSGNVFWDRMTGADIYLVPRKSPQTTHLWPRMDMLAEHIRSTTGEKAYPIIVGGSDAVGFHGYLNAFAEMLDQGVADHFDDVVFACGSGGTAEGTSIGNYLSGAGLRVHGISVSDNAEAFLSGINDRLAQLGLKDVRAEDIYDPIDGYKGRGYGLATDEELEFELNIARQTGITLDPVYTGKAVKGLVEELNNNRQRFQGNRILFIHTGGVFGMLDGRMSDSMLKSSADTVKSWQDMDSPPWI